MATAGTDMERETSTWAGSWTGFLQAAASAVLETGAERNTEASDFFRSGFMSCTLRAAVPAPVSVSVRRVHWVTHQSRTHPMRPSLVSP